MLSSSHTVRSRAEIQTQVGSAPSETTISDTVSHWTMHSKGFEYQILQTGHDSSNAEYLDTSHGCHKAYLNRHRKRRKQRWVYRTVPKCCPSSPLLEATWGLLSAMVSLTSISTVVASIWKTSLYKCPELYQVRKEETQRVRTSAKVKELEQEITYKATHASLVPFPAGH